ncbi:S41 family peptidase [Pseudobacillus badius]|uniref:lmo1851 family serine protease n=1 Tax=Bacillus badius TaxID=1455 RepID=UPI002559AC9D|nr:S41 family peptidase [Bacillus badius]MED0664992.1 S41 family peptidase [Bacillus badius]UAT29176.1 S41 family peptidase [Bacillus badius]
MDENQSGQPGGKHPSPYIRLKRFHFIMLVFFLVFATAAITTLALAFGGEKAAEVGMKPHQEFEKLYEAYDKLEKNYYQDVNKEKLVNGAINGMIDSLDDPYSDYMDKKEANQFHESVSSSFEGIGAEIQEEKGMIKVVSPIKGSPAEKAGLRPNDRILAVDGKSLEGMSSSEAVLLIRGEKGTKVKLKVQPAGAKEPMEMTLVRDEIPIETVYAEINDEKVAHIQITSFSEHTAAELKDAIKDMEAKGMTSMVLDVRQNPGGLLDQAIEITDMFVPEGKILFQVEDNNGKRKKMVSDNKEKISVPVVVLVDSGSASASEIFAAAMKESAGVPIIGEKTFGKGTVQTAEDFKDGSNMKFTTAKWLTPSGNWIHKKGIKPDIPVKLPDYANLSYLSPDNELKLDSLSEEVKTAEKMLEALGYPPGKVDGFFDGETEKAVKDFQKKSNIEQTGVLSGETTVQLMTDLREKIQENDTQKQKAIDTLKNEQTSSAS